MMARLPWKNRWRWRNRRLPTGSPMSSPRRTPATTTLSILRWRPDRLKKWVRQGCFAQVTGGSLTGGFGAGSQQVALRWIGEGLIHFVASDAHNTRGRPLRLQPAYDVVVDRFGEEKARALFQDNPLAAFEGRPLPHIPEVEDELPSPRRKRFFFF